MTLFPAVSQLCDFKNSCLRCFSQLAERCLVFSKVLDAFSLVFRLYLALLMTRNYVNCTDVLSVLGSSH